MLSRPLILIYAILLIVPGTSRGQFVKLYDFHTMPEALFINDHVDEPVMYYFTDAEGDLFRSVDRLSTPITQVCKADIGRYRDMTFVTASNGLAVAEHGVVSTNDSGATWNLVHELTGPGREWRDIQLSMFGHLFIASSEQGLWASSNGGKSWEKRLDGRFSGVAFQGLGGVLTSFDDTPSYFTLDGGLTWLPSTQPISAGRPCYYQPEKAFLAVDLRSNILYRSSNGERWEHATKIEYQTYGDVFSDCDELYIPAYHLNASQIISGYHRGKIGQMQFIRTTATYKHSVYTFARNSIFCQTGSPNKPSFSYNKNTPPPLQINVKDIDVVLPRCSTFTRKFTVVISPEDRGNATITVTPVNTSPSIVLENDRGDTDSALTFTVTLNAGQETEASYLITAERCMTASTLLKIRVRTTGLPLDLVAANVNFGQIGSCTKPTRWLTIRNPDCEPITVKDAAVRQPNAFYRVLSKDFPKVLQPGATDSVLVEFEPSSVGNQSGLVDIDYSVLTFNRTKTAVINATVSNSTAISSLRDTLSFGQVSTCEARRLTTSLSNSGCDKIQIEDIRLRSNSKFALVKSPIGQWLEPGEEAEVELRALTDQTGNFAEDLEIYGKSESNAQVQLRIALLSTVTPSTVGHELSTIGKLTGLTTCNFIDTSVTITNTSTCTDLNVLDVISSNAAVMLREPFLPVTLKPTESATYRLRVQSDQVGEVSSIVNILTDLFGQVSSTIDFDIDEERLETIVMSTPEDPFATTQCKPVTRTFAFETVGCGYLHWSDIQLSPAFTSASRFTLAMPDDQPRKIAAGKRIAFDVTYNPDLTGDDQADLIVIDDRGNVLYQLPLLGTVEDTKTSIGLAMQIDRTEPLRTNEMLTVTIAATDQVDQASGLTQMMTELHFDRDLFRIEAIDAATGINVTQSAIDAGEVLTFSAQPFELTKDQVLAKIVLRPAVTSQPATDITLTGLTLNDGDTEFARCMMTPSTTLATTPATVVLDCAERILTDAMNDRLTFRINAVHPMPAQPGEPIWLDIESEGSGEATLQVIDALGRVVAREDHEFTTGTSRIALRSALSSGYHTLLVRSQSGTSSRPIIVR